LGELLADDPSIAGALSIAPDECAVRSDKESPWETGSFKDAEQ